MAKFKGYKALKKKDLDTLFEENYVVTEDGNEIEYDDETAYITEEEQSIGLPLGLILPSSVYSDSPALHLVDGSSLLQTGIYKDFCNWVKKRKAENSGNVKTCTIEEYATEMATYGQCGKYVINDTEEDLTSGNYAVLANSIKLPTITEFVAANNGGQEIGLAQLDDFKSHSHAIDDNYIDGSPTSARPYAISSVRGTSTGWGIRTIGTGGEETRPKNIRYPYYVVVANATKTDVQVDLENVANEINVINSILAKTEQVELLYDMDGGSQFDWDYDGGLGNQSVSGKDFAPYKKLVGVFDVRIGSGGYYEATVELVVDLTNPTINNNYRGVVTSESLYTASGADGDNSIALFTEWITISGDKTTINVDCVYHLQGSVSSRDAVTKLIKLYGVK